MAEVMKFDDFKEHGSESATKVSEATSRQIVLADPQLPVLDARNRNCFSDTVFLCGSKSGVV